MVTNNLKGEFSKKVIDTSFYSPQKSLIREMYE